MKKYIYSIPLLLFILAGSAGCKKYLDVNHDPNNPANVQESLILFPVEMALSTAIAGGSLTSGNFTTIAVTDAYWTQQLALNQPPPQVDVYQIRPADVDQVFLTAYSTGLQNLLILDRNSRANKNYAYTVTAKTLTAYCLGIMTDHWGDIPYSKGLDGKVVVPYDKQEDVYKAMQSMLDSAILMADAIVNQTLEPGIHTPGSDDALYGGDMSLWKKFAYALKARYYIHLTKAPGYDAATQAGLALDAASKSFASNDEEAKNSLYTSQGGQEGPWYENIDPGQGGVVMASTLINNLKSTNDPRLPILVTKGSGGTDTGRVIGTEIATNYRVYSLINDFYAAADAPSYIFNYSEILFIEAEALFRTAGAAAAQPVFINGINSHMAKLGLDTTSAAVTAYVASRLPLTAGNALQRIMEEKSIANFLNMENYNDWRRTGFPALNIVNSPYVPTIPRRFPYPLAEISANPQPEQSAAITDRVWWDAP
ncbi:SusD/RagB family nutrient-binding outer membrane lipoprotein [Flavitalea sp. BT771]|uniref:SusD/RagB family nutrient-binding outer membrane lipoprotein n=1 Tax=Flavitalea sp. BT771 TaxID=3063329 RepID=UPI0026E294FA|nr:SusD/RagB family nutrient-binding outer membrane lipoprotein [Flavitalea sp. BT771]MDO6431836.1 SusD/RagB family nutrient-binding outer membrane lipoprotein [Flavitalea sp. BT771]MDV6220745.1 SusD/RagB family nutrient-binding outer membrane lipoprotein [Flavitalea sp. BT771]